MTRSEYIVLSDLAHRYGLRILSDIEVSSSSEIDFGPRDACIWWQKEAVINNDCDADDVLHELTHLILGKWSAPPDGGPCEGWILLPFEWRLGLWVMRRLPNKQRADFISSVRFYQDETVVLPLRIYGGFYEKQSPPWRRAEQRAVEEGLLTEKLEPTFVRPDYNTKRRLVRQYEKDKST